MSVRQIAARCGACGGSGRVCPDPSGVVEYDCRSCSGSGRTLAPSGELRRLSGLRRRRDDALLASACDPEALEVVERADEEVDDLCFVLGVFVDWEVSA